MTVLTKQLLINVLMEDLWDLACVALNSIYPPGKVATLWVMEVFL